KIASLGCFWPNNLFCQFAGFVLLPLRQHHVVHHLKAVGVLHKSCRRRNAQICSSRQFSPCISLRRRGIRLSLWVRRPSIRPAEPGGQPSPQARSNISRCRFWILFTATVSGKRTSMIRG